MSTEAFRRLLERQLGLGIGDLARHQITINSRGVGQYLECIYCGSMDAHRVFGSDQVVTTIQCWTCKKYFRIRANR